MDKNSFNLFNDDQPENNVGKNPFCFDEFIHEDDDNNNINNKDNCIINNHINEKNINEVNNSFNKININELDNKDKLEEKIYENNNMDDFANPFQNENEIDIKKENNNNFENHKENNNNGYNNNYDDKADDDFINPFKNFDFKEKKQEKINNIEHYPDNKQKFININNINNINNNDYSNPFNNNNNANININEFDEDENPYREDIDKDNNDFSNPFKDEFNSNNNNENSKDNNSYEIFKKQNNNINNKNIFNTNPYYNNNNNTNNNYQLNNAINDNNYNHFQRVIRYQNNFNNNIQDNINNNKIYINNNQNKQLKIDFNEQNPYNKDVNIEIKNMNYSKDFKTIESIIKKCESLFESAKVKYENYNIREAIETLNKVISTLESIQKTINNKKVELAPFLPQINMLEYISKSTLYNYRLNLYDMIDIKYKSINNQTYKNNESLIDFCSQFILSKSFISYSDIYNNNHMIETFTKNMEEANYRQKKCILLYGDRGSGKTLLVHGYARRIGASVAQVEGKDILKIKFFSKEFVKVCFKNIAYNKPLLVYMKNIENMFNCMNQFDFIYDKVASSFKLNIYFIASTNININTLPKVIYNKFQFFQEVKTVETKNKADYLRFICEKIDIKLNINVFELNNFANQYLESFPNKKIFELVKTAINIKKERTIQSDEPNWVYKEGLNLNDFKNAISRVNPYL